MKISKRLLFLGFVLFLKTPAGDAQYPVREERPLVSRALAGHVYVGPPDTTTLPLDSVTVELCTPGWQSVLASTKTDENGYFVLQRPKTGNLFYLRLHGHGLLWYEVRVRIKKFGPKELTIRLYNAA